MSHVKLILTTLSCIIAFVSLAQQSEAVQYPDCATSKDPNHPVHLPYPTDCTKFYKCSHGYAYPSNCPPGLHWSIELDRCDHPYISKCDPAYIHGPSTDDPKHPEKPTVPSSVSTLQQQANQLCPKNEDPANPTHLTYPNDCTKFYKCFNGVAYPYNCPAGLEWSIVLDRCDYPHIAKCVPNSFPERTPKPASEPTEKPSTPSPVSKLQEQANRLCPKDEDPANPTHLTYPNDCTKFYKCAKGLAYSHDCPRGLEWSITLDRCDYPQIAECVTKPYPQRKPEDRIPINWTS